MKVDEVDPAVQVRRAMKRAEVGKRYEVSAGIPDDPTPWHYVTGVLRSKGVRMKSDPGATFWHIESLLMHHFIGTEMIRQVEEVQTRFTW